MGGANRGVVSEDGHGPLFVVKRRVGRLSAPPSPPGTTFPGGGPPHRIHKVSVFFGRDAERGSELGEGGGRLQASGKGRSQESGRGGLETGKQRGRIRVPGSGSQIPEPRIPDLDWNPEPGTWNPDPVGSSQLSVVSSEAEGTSETLGLGSWTRGEGSGFRVPGSGLQISDSGLWILRPGTWNPEPGTFPSGPRSKVQGLGGSLCF